MRPLILHECDFLVSIPMLGKVESLNVGAAAAVFFYGVVAPKPKFKAAQWVDRRIFYDLEARLLT